MNRISLPHVYFNREGMMYTRWNRDNAREMDIVVELGSSGESLSDRSGMRNKYLTNRNRTYSMIHVSPTVVTSIVRWMENAYGVDLYQRADGELPVKVENTPPCTCGRRMELFWKTWMPSRDEFSSNYNLIWGCPVYGTKCSDRLRTLWNGRSPEVIVDKDVIPTYFHDWTRDGHPIPPEHIVEPLTQWSLAGSCLQVIVPLTKEDNVSRQKVTTFTNVHLTWIKTNYVKLGIEGFSKRFPKFRCSRYDIQRAASRMGATRPYRSRS